MIAMSLPLTYHMKWSACACRIFNFNPGHSDMHRVQKNFFQTHRKSYKRGAITGLGQAVPSEAAARWYVYTKAYSMGYEPSPILSVAETEVSGSWNLQYPRCVYTVWVDVPGSYQFWEGTTIKS